LELLCRYGEDLYLPFFGKVEFFAPEEIAAFKKAEEMIKRRRERDGG